jgi:diguanylate cyclase (GGDEF)-like protein/PAS domain S-box-containing protein
MAISTMDRGVFVEVNDAYCAIAGYARAQMIGKTSIELNLMSAADREQIRAEVARVGYVKDLDIKLVTLEGQVRTVAASIHGARFGGQQCLITTVMDITERRALEKELEYLSQTDMLTGLPNRRHFMQLGQQEWLRAKRFGLCASLLMIDIDRFKGINDRHGHQTGDAVIHRLGRVCADTLREIDIVGRLGGEEFAVVLPQTDAVAAWQVAERLRQAVAVTQLPLESGTPLHFTVSVGVATPAAGETAFEAALGQADKALYEAKRSGRNRVQAH